MYFLVERQRETQLCTDCALCTLGLVYVFVELVQGSLTMSLAPKLDWNFIQEERWSGAGVNCIHLLLHLSRLWYSHRWLHCSLWNQECWCTIHSPATSGQALEFIQVIALMSVQSGMMDTIHSLQGRSQPLTPVWARYEHFLIFLYFHFSIFLHFLPHFGLLGGWLEHWGRPWLHHWFTCYTWAGSGIHTGDCIILCAVRNAGAQYIHLLHLSRLWYAHRWLHCFQICCGAQLRGNHSTLIRQRCDNILRWRMKLTFVNSERWLQNVMHTWAKSNSSFVFKIHWINRNTFFIHQYKKNDNSMWSSIFWETHWYCLLDAILFFVTQWGTLPL